MLVRKQEAPTSFFYEAMILNFLLLFLEQQSPRPGTALGRRSSGISTEGSSLSRPVPAKPPRACLSAGLGGVTGPWAAGSRSSVHGLLHGLSTDLSATTPTCGPLFGKDPAANCRFTVGVWPSLADRQGAGSPVGSRGPGLGVSRMGRGHTWSAGDWDSPH